MFDMPTPLNHINLHVRGGYILPWQKPENTTYYSRKNPLGLIVALNDTGTAKGSFFWDDGEGIDTVENNKYLHITFSVESNTLTNDVALNGLNAADYLKLGVVRIWGVGPEITEVSITTNTETYPLTPQHNLESQELTVDITDLNVNVHQNFQLTWKTKA